MKLYIQECPYPKDTEIKSYEDSSYLDPKDMGNPSLGRCYVCGKPLLYRKRFADKDPSQVMLITVHKDTCRLEFGGILKPL